jgi:hypothetical protein
MLVSKLAVEQGVGIASFVLSTDLWWQVSITVAFANAALASAPDYSAQPEHRHTLCPVCDANYGEVGTARGLPRFNQRQSFASGDGYGGLVIFRGCRNLLRTSPAMVLQPHEPGGRGRLLRATRGGCFAVPADVSQNGVPVNEGVRHLN